MTDAINFRPAEKDRLKKAVGRVKKAQQKGNRKTPVHYKDYIGSVEFSEEDAVFHGKVVGIKSLISFEGYSVSTIVEDFHSAVDEYLDHCTQTGIQPEKPFKGSFNVRIGADLHRKAALAASVRGVSLNTLVEDAIRQTVTQYSMRGL
jgi:predicted HicB family RNase H-like nuclease